MQAAIVDRPLTHFVGLKVTADVDSLVDAVGQSRKQLLARQYEINGIVNPDVQYGVTRPQETESNDDSVTTYIGFEVSDYKQVPADMLSLELPAGKYAQIHWQGSFDSDEFQMFYPSIFNWFKDQSLVPSAVNPWIEMYGKDNNWDDRSDEANELTVLMPLGGPTAQ
jgi:predicted transcriptional regulator YdeE